jgi:hypothetical protein
MQKLSCYQQKLLDQHKSKNRFLPWSMLFNCFLVGGWIALFANKIPTFMEGWFVFGSLLSIGWATFNSALFLILVFCTKLVSMFSHLAPEDPGLQLKLKNVILAQIKTGIHNFSLKRPKYILDLFCDISLFCCLVSGNHSILASLYFVVVSNSYFCVFFLKRNIRNLVSTLKDPLEESEENQENIDDLCDKLFNGKANG